MQPVTWKPGTFFMFAQAKGRRDTMGEIDGIAGIAGIVPLPASSGGDGSDQMRLISRICDAAFQDEVIP
ncbi:MAG: hypothetical protein OXJ64_01650 [Boseongicola sp.]|nr:hypothetical protein [Boseongicola sp.]